MKLVLFNFFFKSLCSVANTLEIRSSKFALSILSFLKHIYKNISGLGNILDDISTNKRFIVKFSILEFFLPRERSFLKLKIKNSQIWKLTVEYKTFPYTKLPSSVLFLLIREEE